MTRLCALFEPAGNTGEGHLVPGRVYFLNPDHVISVDQVPQAARTRQHQIEIVSTNRNEDGAPIIYYAVAKSSEAVALWLAVTGSTVIAEAVTELLSHEQKMILEARIGAGLA